MQATRFCVLVFKRKAIAFLLAILLVSFCQAQKNIVHNNQQWVQYYNQLKVSRKLTIYSDVSLRRINYFDNWIQKTIRCGLGYQFKENLNGISGLAVFQIYNSNKPIKLEFRPYQEINTSQYFYKTIIQHRFRTEARYFREVSNGQIGAKSNFNFRFRYRLFSQIPILKLSEKIPDRILFLNMGDEVFINAGKEIIYNIFDNNRILTGLQYQRDKSLSFSLLYFYQFGRRATQFSYEQSDVFWFSITQKLSLEKIR